jgi:uncharacterized protein with FMN-binding domain
MDRRAVITGGSVAGILVLLGWKTFLTDGTAATSTSRTTRRTGATSPMASASAGSTAGSATRKITGDAADTRYGAVQVAITVSGSRITDVQVPVYPNNDPHDQRINSEAIPILVQQTLTAQSAGIDGVSGATYTSDGYVRSLKSALDKRGG